ncbi:MAG: hypothetical protein AAFO07_27650 [Bacteroidota bacterium]
MLKTKVKASAVTNLTDARYFAAWEVEWLGFNLDQGTDDYIDPNAMVAIKEWVDGVQIVGEFNLPDLETVQFAIDHLGIDQVQVGQLVGNEILLALREKLEIPIIQEIVINENEVPDHTIQLLEEKKDLVDTFLLNFELNNVDLFKDNFGLQHVLKDLCKRFPILITAHFSAEEVNQLLEKTAPLGISLKGGAEEKVGYKSFDELDEIFEAIEILV